MLICSHSYTEFPVQRANPLALPRSDARRSPRATASDARAPLVATQMHAFGDDRASSSRGASGSECARASVEEEANARGSPRHSTLIRGAFSASSVSETPPRSEQDARGGKVELYPTSKRSREHRCNDRLEDVIQALFEGNPLLTVPPAWALFVRCMRSEVGNEPKDPFLYHTPKWLEEARRREKEKRGRWFG